MSRGNGQRSENERHALGGLRVLDLSRMLPGAFCTQLLGDMGAEIVKIEQPGVGDTGRLFEPMAKEESGSFLLLNRNKKSVVLNLKDQRGKELFRKLVADADVLLESFRPGVMDRLELGYEQLKAINPRLIYCAMSGYGQTGPYRLAPGHDLNYMATAGVLQLFGKAGEGPIVPGLSIADIGGGSYPAALGILAALLARGVSGQGQLVDVSMLDGTMAWLGLHAPDFLFTGVEPRGGERPFIGQAACYNVYRCKDGKYISLGAIEAHFWERFCRAVGLEELIDDQWPDDDGARAQRERLQSLFETKTQVEWMTALEDVDVPLAPVNSVEEALNGVQSEDREMFFHIDHPTEGRIPQLGFPIKFSGTPCAVTDPPPRLGEHTADVLGELGLDQASITDLEDAGVIACLTKTGN